MAVLRRIEDLGFRLHAEQLPEIPIRLPQGMHDVLHLVELGGHVGELRFHPAVFEGLDRDARQEGGADQATGRSRREQGDGGHPHADGPGLAVGDHQDGDRGPEPFQKDSGSLHGRLPRGMSAGNLRKMHSKGRKGNRTKIKETIARRRMLRFHFRVFAGPEDGNEIGGISPAGKTAGFRRRCTAPRCRSAGTP